MKRKLLTGLIILLAINPSLPVYAEAGNNIIVQNNQSQTGGKINWVENVIVVTGVGAPPEKGSPAQKRLMAVRAAKADAYRQFAESIHGVKINSETLVEDFVAKYDHIKASVQGIIKGAEQVGDTIYNPDGSVEVVMKVRLFGPGSVASVIMRQELENRQSKEDVKNQEEIKEGIIEKKEIPEIKSENLPNEENKIVSLPAKPEESLKPDESQSAYTAIIIDCSGLPLEPSMSPAVWDEDGKKVYVGNIPIDPDYVINNGIISYVKSNDEAKNHFLSGKNPLILKAKSLKGKFSTDIMISNEDSSFLLGNNKVFELLKGFKVIVVM